MNAFILNCSPVRNGATAAVAGTIAEELKNRYTVKAACIDDYQISFCKGCRRCHAATKCVQHDDTKKLINEFERADRIICVSPSYWMDIPGQFKSFIDRCTPWCNTHEPYAKLSGDKKGYAVALRTGPSMRECDRVIESIEHFYGHLEIARAGSLGLCSVENKNDVLPRQSEIFAFCKNI